MRRRICFFDLDGTLLSHQSNRIPPSTIQAFTLLQAQKIPCILCSGRSLFELDELQQTHVLHFDGSVLLTGAYAVDAAHKRLFDRPIDRGTLDRAVQYLDAHGLSATFTNAHRGWMNRHTDKVKLVQQQIHTKMRPVDDMIHLDDEPVYQITVYADQNEAQNLLAEIPDLHATWWHPQAFDLSTRGVCKGWAMAKMCACMGYAVADAIAFGDGNNDEDMLEEAGLGIAMGNSSPACRAKANYVTADIDDDGVYKALVHFGLIG